MKKKQKAESKVRSQEKSNRREEERGKKRREERERKRKREAKERERDVWMLSLQEKQEARRSSSFEPGFAAW